MSATPKFRKNTAGLMTILLDIHALALSDQVVCTFSSNVCRLLLELKQFDAAKDNSDTVISVGGNYFYECQNGACGKPIAMPYDYTQIDEMAPVPTSLSGIMEEL
jgi:hypothetical protein